MSKREYGVGQVAGPDGVQTQYVKQDGLFMAGGLEDSSLDRLMQRYSEPVMVLGQATTRDPGIFFPTESQLVTSLRGIEPVSLAYYYRLGGLWCLPLGWWAGPGVGLIRPSTHYQTIESALQEMSRQMNNAHSKLQQMMVKVRSLGV